jgi:hypothetical protein
MNDIINKLSYEFVYRGFGAGVQVLPCARERKTNFFRVKNFRGIASLRASSSVARASRHAILASRRARCVNVVQKICIRRDRQCNDFVSLTFTQHLHNGKRFRFALGKHCGPRGSPTQGGG